MTNDPDPTLNDEMRAWLRRMVYATVTSPAERRRLEDEIDEAIAKLNVEGEEPETTEYDGPIIVRGQDVMWKCSACGAEIDPELVNRYNYQIERGGVQPGTQYGPAVVWSEGTIACPGCGARLPYSERSD